MSRIFVTSNTYFGRENEAIKRGFNSVEEMNDVLVENWNKKVKKSDIVYHLGNFCWDPLTGEIILSKLNGVINYIRGTYDQSINELKNHLFTDKLMLVQRDFFHIKTKNVVMSHWPMEIWPGKEDGIIHIYGYPNEKQDDISKVNRMNVSQDLWGLKPVNLDMIFEFFNDVRESNNDS